MLISALDEVKRSGGEYRTLKLYGQERNLITSSIARMNLFLHGVEDFEIIRGDTLADPKHIEGDRLRQFDVILANPPYSIKQWSREAWSSDKWGRNSLGTPPQGPRRLCVPAAHPDQPYRQGALRRALAAWRVVPQRGTGHAGQDGRARLGGGGHRLGVEPVLQLPEESCIVICNRKKTAARKSKVIFIDAVNEVARERAQSFLKPAHQQRILDAYKTFAIVPGFAKSPPWPRLAPMGATYRSRCTWKRVAAAIGTPIAMATRCRCAPPGRSGRTTAVPSGNRWTRSSTRWMHLVREDIGDD
jgi:type I restriction enzyme M protein